MPSDGPDRPSFCEEGVEVGDTREREAHEPLPPRPGESKVRSGDPVGEAIHATAVAIAGEALLILGPSGSGKSRLAVALIAASRPRRPVALIGDDRILLTASARGLMARPHPRIAGFIERRGLGIVASSFLPQAPVRGLVRLGRADSTGSTTSRIGLLENFPCLRHVRSSEIDAAAVLSWWRGASTTPGMKPPLSISGDVKD